MSWGEGYVTEIEYATGYFAKLAPRFAQTVLTLQGVETRGLEAPTYLELGFGQGLSLNLHAAANRGEWWGTDFNPCHVLGAAALAQAAGGDLHLLDDSFEQLAQREDLPQFDMIGLHGIWSWISERNIDNIVAILARRLKPGGTVYLSYNNLTGWAALAPLRELLARRRILLGAAADPVADIKDGLQFAQTLVAAQARYFEAVPIAKAWLEQLTNQDPNYLVHEYFNADWKLMSFPEILERLGDAKLGFAGTADPLKAVEEVALSDDARGLMAGLANNPTLREMVLDYFTMTQLRSDYFQRGVRGIPACDLSARLGALRFIPSADPTAIPMKVKTHRGEVPLNEALYAPLIELLVKHGYSPITFAEIAAALAGHANETQLRKMLLTLIGTDRLAPAHPADITTAVAERTRRLNNYLLERGGKWSGVSHLASPVTGGGVGVTVLDQAFLHARQQGRGTPREWADEVLTRLESAGRRIIHQGEELTDRDRTLSYLIAEANSLAAARLPILGGLGLA